jgi:hypothetical protein
MNKKLILIEALMNNSLWTKADVLADELYEEWTAGTTELSSSEENKMLDYLDKISSAIYGKADDEYEHNFQDMRDIRELMRRIDENKLSLRYLSDKIDKEEEDYLRSQIKELKECLEKKHWTIK